MTYRNLIDIVADYYDMLTGDICQGPKTEPVLKARYMVYLLAKKLIKGFEVRNLADIVGKDRTTIIKWETKGENLLITDSNFNKDYIYLYDNLNNKEPIRYNSLKRDLDSSINHLIENGEVINTGEWQSRKVDHPMIEVCGLIFECGIPDGIKQLADECKADLPWAEDHFQERISGVPSNPGKAYLTWPYYKPGTFKEDGDKFSHTYMERFFPTHAGDPKLRDFSFDAEGGSSNKGIRYPYGDLNDIINRLIGNPFTRQAYLSIWHPEDQSNNGVRLPCTLGYHFLIRKGKLNITYHIRSCDAVRHFRNDIYMACRLAQHVVELFNTNGLNENIVVGNITTWIGSFHCFQSDLYTLKKRQQK